MQLQAQGHSLGVFSSFGIFDSFRYGSGPPLPSSYLLTHRLQKYYTFRVLRYHAREPGTLEDRVPGFVFIESGALIAHHGGTEISISELV